MGCGPSGIDGWLNYDWGWLPLLSKVPILRRGLIRLGVLPENYEVSWPAIRLVDIRKRLPLRDASVDYIYCSHVLEHFEEFETIGVLKECYRVLKKGGVIRIVLPDLEKMVENYKGAKQFNLEFFGYRKNEKSVINNFVRGHQWMYDKSLFLKIIGGVFDEAKIESFGVGKVPDLDRLDLVEHKSHSLYIEATK